MKKYKEILQETFDTGNIRIKGFAINRGAILINDVLPLYGDFDWGIQNPLSMNLSTSIIQLVYGTHRDMLATAKNLQTLIANLPIGNFDIEINIKQLKNIWDGNLKFDKSIHIYQLIKSKIGNKYYPMIIDFLNLPYKEFIYESNTIQYKLLESLSTDEINAIKQYVHDNSKHKDTSGTYIHTEVVGFLELKPHNRKTFLVRNGMGTDTDTGLLVDTFHYL